MKNTKLFCFPSAGSSAAMFFPLGRYLKGNIEICPIEQAGKGSRIEETFYADFNALINDTVSGMLSIGGLNSFALFGYSMGSLVAYEVALALYYTYSILPECIFFAAFPPPHVPTKSKYLYKKDDKAFVDELMKLGGLPSELVNSPDLLDFFLPSIRSDFRLIQEYDNAKTKPPLPVDIAVLYSEIDAEDYDITEWDKYTTKTCEYFCFSLGHFFINQKVGEIGEIISERINT